MSYPSFRSPARTSFGRALALTALALLLTAPASFAEEDESATIAPDFTGQGLDGKTYKLSELLVEGPVYLDFWATWCKPCQIALPKLAELHEKYGERGFTLLTVASDDQKTISKVKPLVKSRGWDFPVLLDAKREIGNQYSVRSYPTSYLIGRDGKVLSVHVGYRPGDEKKLEEEIVALLPEEPATSESEGDEH